MKCPKCGYEGNKPYQKRCTICDSPLNAKAPEPEPEMQPVSEPGFSPNEETVPAPVQQPDHEPEPTPLQSVEPKASVQQSSTLYNDSEPVPQPIESQPVTQAVKSEPPYIAPVQPHCDEETTIAAKPQQRPEHSPQPQPDITSVDETDTDIPAGNGYDDAPVVPDGSEQTARSSTSILATVLIALATGIVSLIIGAVAYLVTT